MIKFSIDKAIVTKKFLSEKSGKTYLTVTDGVNEMNLSCGDLDPKSVPLLEPLKFEGELSASMYGRNQNLTLLKLNVSQIEK